MRRSNTKQMRHAYERYLRSDKADIYQAYNKPSDNKLEAWEDCEALCKRYKGENLKVIAYGTWSFSAGFIGKTKDVANGTYKRIFVYITKDNTRFMEI